MSDTPRTDDVCDAAPWTISEHARNLERELAAARAELERAMRVVEAASKWGKSAFNDFTPEAELLTALQVFREAGR